jgi:D-glycero-D-manno-heptose 1,7-bisphosphate phosphatase
MQKAVFLDRDGVINRNAPEGQYITRWEDFEFLPKVADGIHLLHQANFAVIVVSNQRCVAKGLLAVQELEDMHRRMLDHLARSNAKIDAVYYCPHDNVPACPCRKPAPGMLLHAAQEQSIDLSRSWMVGDSDSDMEAGKSAGCRTVRILTPEPPPRTPADLTADSLYEAAVKITSS